MAYRYSMSLIFISGNAKISISLYMFLSFSRRNVFISSVGEFHARVNCKA